MVVLVTGASKGIGEATALKFAKNGYDVVINYYSDTVCANKVKENVGKYGVKCLLCKCDISNEEEVKNIKPNFVDVGKMLSGLRTSILSAKSDNQ